MEKATPTLTDEDMHRVIRLLPTDIVALMQERSLFLAGGYLRASIAGEEVNDIDLFCDTKELCEINATKLAADRNVKVIRTVNAFTVLSPPRLPVQFIHRWTYPDAKSLIDSFDFTIAKVAIWFKDGVWNSITDFYFYPDLASKRLRYTFPDRIEEVGGSLLRVLKFARMGYHITPESYARVIARLVNGSRGVGVTLDPTMEAAQATVLADLLRKVDPLTLIDGLTPTNDSLEYNNEIL